MQQFAQTLMSIILFKNCFKAGQKSPQNM